jgi:hypothetical protein
MVSRLSLVAPNDKIRAHFGPMSFFALILKVLRGIGATRSGEAGFWFLDFGV